MRYTLLLSLIALVLLCGVASAAKTNSRRGTVDPQSVTIATAMLRERIIRAIHDAGGDADTQQVHLVLAFSTGHYRADPLGMAAANAIAERLIQNFLVSHDSLSIYAWEQHLWAEQPIRNPLRIGSDDEAGKAGYIRLFPRAPRPGSRGGHDTEEALTEITQKLPGSTDAVIVLLTTGAASARPAGGRIIGTRDTAYLAVLRQWRRVAYDQQTAASLVLPYTIHLPRYPPILRQIEAVVVLPRHFFARVITNGTRTSRLRAHPLTSPIPLLCWLLALALIGGGGTGILLTHLTPRVRSRRLDAMVTVQPPPGSAGVNH